MKPHITESDLRSGYADCDGRGYHTPALSLHRDQMTVRGRLVIALDDAITALEVAGDSPELNHDRPEDLNDLLRWSVLRRALQKERDAMRSRK